MAATDVINFDADDAWDNWSVKGPAIHTPDAIKAIVITTYRVEWIDISVDKENFYAKNHMVAAVTFAEPTLISDRTYFAAQLSMELGHEAEVLGVGEGYISGHHYFPGVYTLQLRQYKGTSNRSAHHVTYNLRRGTTIGTLVNMVILSNMHHFLFLPYTKEGRWKGCGDHLLHTWAMYVRNGDITDKDSVENPSKDLSDELTQTYHNGAHTFELIGRGWWLRHNVVQDELTPETTYTPARLTYQY